MDVRIGIQNVTRELVLETDESVEDLSKQVADATANGTLLKLTDSKGRQLYVAGAGIAYVEFGGEKQRPVGFAQA